MRSSGFDGSHSGEHFGVEPFCVTFYVEADARLTVRGIRPMTHEAAVREDGPHVAVELDAFSCSR